MITTSPVLFRSPPPQFSKARVPDCHALNQLRSPSLLRSGPFGSLGPSRRQSRHNLAETSVICRACERNGTERRAEIIRQDHPVALHVQIPPQVVRVALLADYRLAIAHHVFEMLGDAGQDITAPNIVVAASVGAEEVCRYGIAHQRHI